MLEKMLENKNAEGKETSSTSTTSQNDDIAGNIDVLQSQHSNVTPCKKLKLEAFGNISDENKQNNSSYTSRSIGIQCNTYVKSLISVGVQTDVSALNTTRFAEQAVQCEASSTANPDTSEQNVGMQCDPAPLRKNNATMKNQKGHLHYQHSPSLQNLHLYWTWPTTKTRIVTISQVKSPFLKTQKTLMKQMLLWRSSNEKVLGF